MQTAYQEITAMRKSGQLTEAAALAHQALIEFPQDLWLRRAAAWVFYDELKRAIYKVDLPSIDHWYLKLKSLCLPDDEAVFWQSVWNQLGELLIRLGQLQRFDAFDQVLAYTTTLPVERPSDVYSHWLGQVLIAGRHWEKLADFIIDWDIANLQPEDYVPPVHDDGNTGLALAEEAHISLARALLAQEEIADQASLLPICLILLERLVTHHHRYQYAPFYITQILIKLGQTDEAIKRANGICQANTNVFWAWRNLAECYALSDPNQYIIFLQRAVEVGTQKHGGPFAQSDADKLGPTRLALATALLDRGDKPGAAEVLRQYRVDAESRQKPLPKQYERLASRTAGW
jgi:hypothetical protein